MDRWQNPKWGGQSKIRKVSTPLEIAAAESISIQKETSYELSVTPLLPSPNGNKYHPSADSKCEFRKEARAGRR